MTIRAYCKIPKVEKKTVRPLKGGCPELLDDLLVELEGASEVHIAAYLFNNPVYFEFLKNLASKGSKVFITTLPERGYSNKKLKTEGYKDKISGRDMAQRVFSDAGKHPNISLKFFPHQYIWYGALYAGGGASYSFHVKAIYAKFPGDKNKCILSSGNFMFTDPYHSDSIIVFESEPEYETVFAKFFADLEGFSIGYDDFYSNYSDYEDEFLITYDGREINMGQDNLQNCYFTAPFYLVNGVGSNHYAGNRIIDLINKAKSRVWVCTQHFHDVVSYDQNRETIVKALYDKAREDYGVELRFLKQVPNSSLADKRRAAITETLFQYGRPAAQRYNRLVHDKFMLIDDNLVFTTANYTPTQFAFGNRKMEYKDTSNRKFVKQDNFSEVNGFAIIQGCPEEITNQFENHFNQLWSAGEEIQINL